MLNWDSKCPSILQELYRILQAIMRTIQKEGVGGGVGQYHTICIESQAHRNVVPRVSIVFLHIIAQSLVPNRDGHK